MTFPEFLIEVNANYSGLLTVLVALITAFITLAYVHMAYKQFALSKLSLESAERQTKLNSQPCIIPKITETIGTELFTETRRQLHFNVELNNVGNSPAIAIFTIGHLKLRYTKHEDTDKVDMCFYPDFMPILSLNEKAIAGISFEAKEIELLVEDLEHAYRLNIERLKTDGHRPSYRGTNIVIKVYFKNLLGQWFESTLTREIAWLIDLFKEKSDSHDLNKYTIPPKKLLKNTRFKLQLISERFSPADIRLIDADAVRNILDSYKNGMPGFDHYFD